MVTSLMESLLQLYVVRSVGGDARESEIERQRGQQDPSFFRRRRRLYSLGMGCDVNVRVQNCCCCDGDDVTNVLYADDVIVV